jgi:hypothetical protein
VKLWWNHSTVVLSCHRRRINLVNCGHENVVVLLLAGLVSVHVAVVADVTMDCGMVEVAVIVSGRKSASVVVAVPRMLITT